MKLSKKEIQEIVNNLEKGLTLCLPQEMSLKDYQKIIKQIKDVEGVILN
jgi:exonuclease VII small subunit